MDFLDPKKQFRHKIILITGYILIACLVVGATTVLLYEAYGFGLGKGGNIIQNGLVYLSSQPNPATVYINGKLTSTTNTSITLPEGIYNVMLTRSGYRTWSRKIEVDGGVIEDYTYPMLIPTKLVTTKVKSYSSLPVLATQSLDRSQLLIQLPNSSANFDLFNLSKPSQAPTQISIPTSVLPTPTVPVAWQVVAWSDDNTHVLLEGSINGKTEYLLFDVKSPSQSVDLSHSLSNVTFTAISLDNGKYDQYYLYNSANDTLMTDNLSSLTSPKTVLSNVLAYDTYNGNTVLYATANGAPSGKVNIDIYENNTNYRIKTLPASPTYLLNMAGYSGSVYVVAGASSEGKIYIFNDPVGQLNADPKQAPVPQQVMLVNNPNFVSFSANTQFIAAEGGEQFAVYNLENSSGYNYNTKMPLDSPQLHATWMDGDRLTYVSGSKLVMFEYDHNYVQQLMPASPSSGAFFTPGYNYVYSLAPGAKSTFMLTRTSLYTSADQPQKIS